MNSIFKKILHFPKGVKEYIKNNSSNSEIHSYIKAVELSIQYLIFSNNKGHRIREFPDFSKNGEIDKIKKEDANYMIASAENPMGIQEGNVENKQRKIDFEHFLRQNNITFRNQIGKYGRLENSHLIKIENTDQRIKIDQYLEKYSPQDENILIIEGYVYRYDPRTKESFFAELSNADIISPENVQDFYSEIDGSKYKLPLYETTDQKCLNFIIIYNS